MHFLKLTSKDKFVIQPHLSVLHYFYTKKLVGCNNFRQNGPANWTPTQSS